MRAIQPSWPLFPLPPSLKAEISGDIAIVTIDRAAKRNALDDALIVALHRLFAEMPPEAKAAILLGEGEHFCAGLDLTELSDRDVVAGIGHSRLWHQAFEAIQFGRVPVVAVLHGAVVGGGLELACATHIRVAERSAFYALPEGQRGIFVGGGGSVRLPRLIGVARMADMMLTGRIYGAEEGMAIGLSQYVVGPGAGRAKALELAGKIAGNAQLTNFAVMHALPRIAEADPAAGLMMEALMSAIAQGDPAAKARLEAFLEKRAAKLAHG